MRSTLLFLAPLLEGATPTMEGATPTMEGATPTMEGATPTMEGATPTMEGATSRSHPQRAESIPIMEPTLKWRVRPRGRTLRVWASSYFTNNWRGKSHNKSTPVSVIRILSVSSMPQSSCQIPGMKWKAIPGCNSVSSVARKLAVRSPQSGG